LRSDDSIPEADYVVMQAGLYHFLPNPIPIISRILAAARSGLVIAEPIRNLTSSRLRPLSWLARTITNPGTGITGGRFTDETLNELFSNLDLEQAKTFLVAGGREREFTSLTSSGRS
jgi:hypothetical protein